MNTTIERRESLELYEFSLAMVTLYKSSICDGEVQLSGAAFRAACSFADAVASLAKAPSPSARFRAWVEARRKAHECRYWLWLLEGTVPADRRRMCERVAAATDTVLLGLESMQVKRA